MKKTTEKPTKKTPAKAKRAKAGVSTKRNKGVCLLPGADLLDTDMSVDQIMKEIGKGNEIKELEPKQERFCREYIIDENATRAYQRIYGCGYNAARANSVRLIAKANIKQRIEVLRDERNKRLEISADKVLRRLEARATVTPRDFYDAEGQFIPIHELPPEIAIGIKSIEVAELFAGSGEERTAVGLVRKITMHDGKASDELLGRNLKLWKDVGSADNPVTFNKIERKVIKPEHGDA